jgi:hypothetical protein
MEFVIATKEDDSFVEGLLTMDSKNNNALMTALRTFNKSGAVTGRHISKGCAFRKLGNYVFRFIKKNGVNVLQAHPCLDMQAYDDSKAVKIFTKYNFHLTA